MFILQAAILLELCHCPSTLILAMAPEPADDVLIDRVRQADQEAFRELFERYQPVVFRQMLFRTRDADSAHEVVQETFVRIWEHRRSLRSGKSFLAFALRISSNIVRDMARHQAMRTRVAASIPRPELSEGDDPAGALHLALLEDRLQEIINTHLPQRCRMIFLLSRFEGMSHRDIAARLGVSTKTVENQITRALRILRTHLG